MDLVPVEYRQVRRMRRWVRGFALVQGGLLLALVLAKAGLAYGEAQRRREIQELQAAEQLARDTQARLVQLDAERVMAERRLSILDGLRGGISSGAVFGAVDAALAEGVWFLDWTFSRAGQLVESAPKAEQAGYFLVIPLDGEDDAYEGRAWRLETHMEIRGRSLDHSTLARFVGRLLDQPRIEQVRIVSTRAQAMADREVIAFELAVIVSTDA